MRNSFADTFYELSAKNDLLCLVVADISPAGSIEKFRNEFPNRFINTGVAEQIMIGMCAGLAQRGFRPFAYTIATFALFRPFEFIRNDLCYQNLPVTVVGIGGGINYSTLGTTHHAQEDIALVSSLPNMKIIAPSDPLETKYATEWCANQNEGSPAYLRLGRAGEPNLTSDALEPWVFGKFRKIKSGSDFALITYGSIAKEVRIAHNELELQGLSGDLYFVSTLKPIDKVTIYEILDKHKKVFVVEEHISFGGLADRIKLLAFEKKWDGKLIARTLPMSFQHIYGDQSCLYKENLLDSYSISNMIKESLNS